MRSSYHSVNRWLRNTSDPDDSVHSSLHTHSSYFILAVPSHRWNECLLSGPAHHYKI